MMFRFDCSLSERALGAGEEGVGIDVGESVEVADVDRSAMVVDEFQGSKSH